MIFLFGCCLADIDFWKSFLRSVDISVRNNIKNEIFYFQKDSNFHALCEMILKLSFELRNEVESILLGIKLISLEERF